MSKLDKDEIIYGLRDRVAHQSGEIDLLKERLEMADHSSLRHYKAIQAANRGIKRLKRKLAARDAKIADLEARQKRPIVIDAAI